MKKKARQKQLPRPVHIFFEVTVREKRGGDIVAVFTFDEIDLQHFINSFDQRRLIIEIQGMVMR